MRYYQDYEDDSASEVQQYEAAWQSHLADAYRDHPQQRRHPSSGGAALRPTASPFYNPSPPPVTVSPDPSQHCSPENSEQRRSTTPDAMAFYSATPGERSLAPPIEELRSSVQHEADKYTEFFRDQIRRHTQVFGQFEGIATDLVSHVESAHHTILAGPYRGAPIPPILDASAPTPSEVAEHRTMIRHLWTVFQDMRTHSALTCSSMEHVMLRLIELSDKYKALETFSSRLSSDYESLTRQMDAVIRDNMRLRDQEDSGPTPWAPTSSASIRSRISSGSSGTPLHPTAVFPTIPESRCFSWMPRTRAAARAQSAAPSGNWRSTPSIPAFKSDPAPTVVSQPVAAQVETAAPESPEREQCPGPRLPKIRRRPGFARPVRVARPYAVQKTTQQGNDRAPDQTQQDSPTESARPQRFSKRIKRSDNTL